MSLNHHIALIQRKILPVLNIMLFQCIKSILNSWKLSISVFLSCNNLIYFWIYLSFSWGRLLCQIYSTQIGKTAGDLANNIIQYSFPINNRKIRIQQSLDEVLKQITLELQSSVVDNIGQVYSAHDVIEDLIPLKKLLREVKTENNRERKFDTWVTIIVNCWTQVLLFPYIIANLQIFLSLDGWCDLETLESVRKDLNEKIEFSTSNARPKVDYHTPLGRLIKQCLHEYVKPVASLVRHCLFQYVSKVEGSFSLEQLNSQHLDKTSAEKKIEVEELLKAQLGRDDLKGILLNIRSSLKIYMPCIYEECLLSNKDQSRDILPFLRSESCTNLRTYLTDKIFDEKCLPFLNTCLVESSSYTETEERAKLLHLCVNITAKLRPAVNTWLMHEQAIEDFLLNIEAV